MQYNLQVQLLQSLIKLSIYCAIYAIDFANIKKIYSNKDKVVINRYFTFTIIIFVCFNRYKFTIFVKLFLTNIIIDNKEDSNIFIDKLSVERDYRVVINLYIYKL